MNRANVKILMLRKKINITTIARELNVTPQMIYDVIAGKRTSRRIEEVLEAIFDMSVTEIRAAWNNEGVPEIPADIRAIVEEVNSRVRVPRAAVGL